MIIPLSHRQYAGQSLPQIASRLALRSAQRFLHVSVLHGLLLTPETVRPGQTLTSFKSGFVHVDQLVREAKDPESGLRLDDVQRWIAAGEECFGTFVDGVLASYIWFSPRKAHLERDIFVQFDPLYAYSRWAFTRADYRGRSLYGVCKHQALVAHAMRGSRGILSVVYAWNRSSLNAASKLGCVRIGRMCTVGTRVWTDASCQRAGLRLEHSPLSDHRN